MTAIKSDHAEVLSALADGVPRRTRDIFPLTTEIADTAALSKIINYLAKTKFWIAPSKDDQKAYQLTELGQEALDAHHGKQDPQKQTELAKRLFDEHGTKNTLDAIPVLDHIEDNIEMVEQHTLDPECPIDAVLLNLSATIKREVLANKITITDKNIKITVLAKLAEQMNDDIRHVLTEIMHDIEKLTEES